MNKYIGFLILGIILLIAYSMYSYVSYYNGKLEIVFCDVGQGDAVLVKSPEGNLMIFDAGPDKSVLGCISENIPFWKKDIDLFVLSHPHLDHYAGLFDLLNLYDIRVFGTEEVGNKGEIYGELRKLLSMRKIITQNLFYKDSYRLGKDVRLRILGPSREYIRRTSPSGNIGESREFASLIMLIEYKKFSLLLTGDSQEGGLAEAVLKSKVSDVDVLQTPHHGSKTGLNERIVKILSPKTAVISVGKNKYGHPSGEILKIYDTEDVDYYRTDLRGAIRIETDGDRYLVRTER